MIVHLFRPIDTSKNPPCRTLKPEHPKPRQILEPYALRTLMFEPLKPYAN